MCCLCVCGVLCVCLLAAAYCLWCRVCVFVSGVCSLLRAVCCVLNAVNSRVVCIIAF